MGSVEIGNLLGYTWRTNSEPTVMIMKVVVGLAGLLGDKTKINKDTNYILGPIDGT